MAKATTIENHFTAWMANPNDPTLPNKIHAADGAQQYGFKAALVGGVTLYGWCIPTILTAVGEGWLDHGWVEVHFKRPTYPGDKMMIEAVAGDNGEWEMTATKQDGEVCIRASFGLGDAPFADIYELSNRMPADPPRENLERLTLANAPVSQDLLTMPVKITPEEARETVDKQLREENPLYVGANAIVHPWAVARHMMRLLSYSYDYGKPSIHISSHVQNLKRIPVGTELVLTGHFVRAYERHGHHCAVFDGSYRDVNGNEYARVRHTNIFNVKPREE
ncbi:MAG: hypothetical protein ABIP13_06910 [Tepidiformaceae bacterium]